MKRLYLTLFIFLAGAAGSLQAQSLEKNIEKGLMSFSQITKRVMPTSENPDSTSLL